MNRVYSIADQAQACLARLNFQHKAFENVDVSSLSEVARSVRKGIVKAELPLVGSDKYLFSRESEKPEEIIERCLGNTWRVCGHEYTLEELDYNISPDPAENSPGKEFGEWTWQLNRHYEWPTIANYYAQSQNPKAVEAICSWLMTWIETCPAPTEDFNTELTSWRTIEIGIRLGGIWPQVFNVMKAVDDFDSELMLAWMNSVGEQCEFVWEHRKTRNWLMMEMNGLLTASLMFPFFKQADEWRKKAIQVYLEEINNQFLEDGMQVELSASYHGVSFLQYLRAYTVLRGAGHEVPEPFMSGMRKMLAPWRAMLKPDGRAFCFQDSGPVEYSHWLRKIPADLHSPSDAFFLSEGPPPDHLNDFLSHAGQCVLRSGWSLKDTAIAMDVGPYGAAHQHEDKLSLQIWSRGHDLIGEAGKVNYSDSPQRSYSLGTLAHSTAIVDGCQQNSRRLHLKMGGTQASDGPVKAQHDLNCTTPWVQGAYEDGYGDQGEVAVRHERRVVLNSADLVTITDRFTAQDDRSHRVEILFHLLKDGYEMLPRGARSTGDGPQVELVAHRGDDKTITVSGVCGGEEPDLRGWAEMDRKDYRGSKDLVPRPCITISCEMVKSLEVITEIRISS